MLMKYMLFVWFVVFSTNLMAWPTRVAEQSPRFEHPPESFIDTILGACKTPDYKGSWYAPAVPGKDSFTFRVQPSGHGLFKNKTFSTTAFYAKSKGKLKNAPLMVILPGIFTSSDDNTSLALAVAFNQRGYHVVIVPNGWSKEFIDKSARPMGDLDYEADVVLRVISQFQTKLRNQGVLGRTQLLGVSYGGFLGSMVAYRDFSEGHNLIDGQVIVLGAPFNMKWALQNLDTYMDRSDSFAKKRTGFADAMSKSFFCNGYEELKIDVNKPLDKASFSNYSKVAQHLVIQRGFKTYLKNAITKVDGNEYSNLSLPTLIPNNTNSKNYRQWEKRVRFKRYFNDYDLNALLNKYSDHSAYLAHWVNSANFYGEKKILVMQANNDFLNDNIPAKKMDEALLVLHRGGHLGYASWEWTQNLLFYMFDKDLKYHFAGH